MATNSERRSSREAAVTGSSTSPPLRVLHVFESFKPHVVGYTTRSWKLLEAQRDHSTIQPFALVTSRQSTYGYEEVESMDGVTVDRLQPSTYERSRRKLQPYFIDRAALKKKIETTIKRNAIDLVHVHFAGPIGLATALAAKACGRPLVAEIRFDLAGAVLTELLPCPLPPLERVLRAYFDRHLRHADAVIFASHSLGAFIRRSLSKEIPHEVVVNGISGLERNESDRRRMREELRLDHAFVVGTTSTHFRYEGLGQLIEAGACLRKKKDDRAYHFLFVGDGPQRKRLERKANELGVSATFLGNVPYDEVAAYVSAMDAFVTPRIARPVTRFASPIKVVEAMELECPIIATPVGDLPRLLAGGRGVLLENHSKDTLLTAISRLGADERIGNALVHEIRKWKRDAPTWADAASTHEKVYAKVAGRPV